MSGLPLRLRAHDAVLHVLEGDVELRHHDVKAELQQHAGRHAERALGIRERVLGLTAEGVDNLAGLLRQQAELATARPLLERALDILVRVLGPDHPDTVATRRALAELAAEANDASTIT